MDSQGAAGQGDAKAHSKTHRAPIGGRLGLGVVLRFRLNLPSRALRIHATCIGSFTRRNFNIRFCAWLGFLDVFEILRKSVQISAKLTQ